MAGPTHSIQLYPLFGLCIINNFLELESFAKIFYFVYPFPLAPPPSQFPNTTQPANPPPPKCDLFFSMIYAYSALGPPTLAHQPICLLKMLRLIDDSLYTRLPFPSPPLCTSTQRLVPFSNKFGKSQVGNTIDKMLRLLALSSCHLNPYAQFAALALCVSPHGWVCVCVMCVCRFLMG